MPLLHENHYTVADYWNTPEGERRELIDATSFTPTQHPAERIRMSFPSFMPQSTIIFKEKAAPAVSILPHLPFNCPRMIKLSLNPI